ncbi:LysR substrate-binding domain-containing protein [Vibrio mangrovi]|uniref:Glycine cleavage system transcriptional activator n=1 Tax=Vibrio mangrovi TaxID=474394 RepID=A0A1Y6IW00_9VIBR|nr:LysR substrate-binding domain-containing protein [Vibrio mangrovi]MDW6005061.1 LysR substrate-binding domain-containing protein [Vibrio mangrovi]SMS01829.1 Glycine cleavage system transcriptional activator [Vibrio mangrovi]
MKTKLPPLYALRAFEVTVQYGSVTQAAGALHVTPGAVSRHIKTLETWFDCKLFNRSGPKITVTEAGMFLAKQLREGFQHLENACEIFLNNHSELRLKAPSTLTMRWLLDVLSSFREENSSFSVSISSIWMDIDRVNFNTEPYDCGILLGDGQFGTNTESRLLFEEWLVPVCAPAYVQTAQNQLAECELIHPSPDRRDWRRWLKKTEQSGLLNLSRGKVFDTLEQGNMAAIGGHGLTVSDLRLIMPTVRQGLLAFPFSEAVFSGEGYYLVWPANSYRKASIDKLFDFLTLHLPAEIPADIHLIH